MPELAVEKERKYLLGQHEAKEFIAHEQPVRIDQTYISAPHEHPELRVRKESFANNRQHYTATLKLGELPFRQELEVEISPDSFDYWETKGVNHISKLRYHLPHMAGRLALDRLTINGEQFWLAELEGGSLAQEAELADKWQDVTTNPRFKNRNIGIKQTREAPSPTNQEEVIEELRERQAAQANPMVIGIAGGSGSGKTTLARKLREETNGMLISTDDYYRGKTYMRRAFGYTFEEINWDHPEAWSLRFIGQQLGELASGQTVEKPRYSMVDCDPQGITEHIKALPGNPIIVEGLYTLHPDMVDALDVKLFVDAPVATRVARRVQRDLGTRETSWPIESNFRYCMEVAEPTYAKHGQSQKKSADMVIYT